MPSRLAARDIARHLWQKGIRNASYAARVSGVSIRTMQLYFQKLREGRSLEDLPRSGRPRKRTPALTRAVSRRLEMDPKATAARLARQVSADLGILVSERTVRDELHDEGYRFRLPRHRLLTPPQKAQRVIFARGHRGDSWATTASGDEATFSLCRTKNRLWVRVNTATGEDEPSLPV